MWQDKLKEIIYILENSNVNEIEVNFWGRKYKVVKNANISTAVSSLPDLKIVEKNKSADKLDIKEEPKEVESTVKGESLLSPMPGTFYSSPTPDDPAFVSKGDTVKKGTTLCIIEAMKIMNEIEAEYDGKVVDILVNNSEPVEYNQPLFVIDPS
jgi:acetyl-CoA carboxylase biotin carboxyl carrier protein